MENNLSASSVLTDLAFDMMSQIKRGEFNDPGQEVVNMILRSATAQSKRETAQALQELEEERKWLSNYERDY